MGKQLENQLKDLIIKELGKTVFLKGWENTRTTQEASKEDLSTISNMVSESKLFEMERSMMDNGSKVFPRVRECLNGRQEKSTKEKS